MNERKERLSVTVPGSVIENVKKMADSEKRTLSNMISILLEKAVEENKKAA